MKPLLGPLEIRRRLILEKKGRRERFVDWTSKFIQKLSLSTKLWLEKVQTGSLPAIAGEGGERVKKAARS